MLQIQTEARGESEGLRSLGLIHDTDYAKEVMDESSRETRTEAFETGNGMFKMLPGLEWIPLTMMKT